MRARWLIWVLQAVTLFVVLAIFYWQVRTLPSLRQQIVSGLENNMSTITRDAAKELSDAWSVIGVNNTKALIRAVDPEKFSAPQLNELKKIFKSIAPGQKQSEAWVAVFINPSNGALNAWEYKFPSRYRPDTDVLGSWRQGTEVTRIVEAELYKEMARFKSIGKFNTDYWASAPDSTIQLLQAREYNPVTFTGGPVYDKGELKGFIFTKLSLTYFEEKFIPEFWETAFWRGGEFRENLEHNKLQFGVFSTSRNRWVYNSIAFGKKDFESQEALSGVNPWLSDYVVGVRFRNATVESVGTSIYNRVRNRIFAMFVVLILLLLLIFGAARRLAFLSNLKSEFVSNVTHEIKTPLSSIQLAADTLRLKRAMSEEQRESCLLIIQKETERLQDMIHNLLDFSKLESGKTQFRFEKVNAGEWWEHARQFVKERAGKYFGEAIGEAPAGNLRVDQRAMEQVLWIFIDNALKYSPDHKQIDLRIARQGKMLRVDVKDYGIGIAPEHQQLIFDKFVRIGNTDVHNVKGYGIGLSISAGILKGHGGSVGVESEPGKGSSFYFLLPLKPH